MSNGNLILNTFGTRLRSQFAASFRTRPTLLARLTDVDVSRNLTQTASTLQQTEAYSVPQPLKLYGVVYRATQTRHTFTFTL